MVPGDALGVRRRIFFACLKLQNGASRPRVFFMVSSFLGYTLSESGCIVYTS